MSLYIKYRPALKQAFHIELMSCEHRSIVSLSTKVCDVSSINSFQSLHASYKITGSSAHRGSLVQKKNYADSLEKMHHNNYIQVNCLGKWGKLT